MLYHSSNLSHSLFYPSSPPLPSPLLLFSSSLFTSSLFSSSYFPGVPSRPRRGPSRRRTQAGIPGNTVVPAFFVLMLVLVLVLVLVFVLVLAAIGSGCDCGAAPDSDNDTGSVHWYFPTSSCYVCREWWRRRLSRGSD